MRGPAFKCCRDLSFALANACIVEKNNGSRTCQSINQSWIPEIHIPTEVHEHYKRDAGFLSELTVRQLDTIGNSILRDCSLLGGHIERAKLLKVIWIFLRVLEVAVRRGFQKVQIYLTQLRGRSSLIYTYSAYPAYSH